MSVRWIQREMPPEDVHGRLRTRVAELGDTRSSAAEDLVCASTRSLHVARHDKGGRATEQEDVTGTQRLGRAPPKGKQTLSRDDDAKLHGGVRIERQTPPTVSPKLCCEQRLWSQQREHISEWIAKIRGHDWTIEDAD